jgi:hypothetical protein
VLKRLSVTTELARIFEKINAFRQRVWTLTLLRGAVGAAWFWLTSLLLLGALNLLYPFPTPVRLGFLLGHLLLVGIGFWVGLRRSRTDKRGVFRRRMRAWALRCEELAPGLKGRLVTCVDVAGEPDGEKVFETNPVAKALLRETSERFESFDPAGALPGRAVLMTFLMGCLPPLFLAFLLSQDFRWTRSAVSSLYRYRMPVVSSSPFFRGRVEIKGLTVRPGDVEVPRGSSVAIEAQVDFTGAFDPEGPPVVHVAEKAGQMESYAMIQDKNSTQTESTLTFRTALHEVMNPARYQVRLTPPGKRKRSQIKSPTYKIEPYDPPNVESLDSTVTPPAYTRLPEEEIQGAYIAGLENSRVTLRARSDRALSSARLAGGEGRTLEARIVEAEDTGKPQVAEFQFEISQGEELRLEVVDKAGHRNLDPPMIVVSARKDDPPSIRMKRPGADWAVHRLAEVELEVEAADDYGLKEALWTYRINGGSATTETLFADRDEGGGTPEGKPVRKQNLRRFFPLEDVRIEDRLSSAGERSLEAGDSIYYRFIARDGQPNAAKGTAISQPFFLTIRPFEQVFYKGGAIPPGPADAPPPPTQRQVIVATTRLADRLEAEKAGRPQPQTVGEALDLPETENEKMSQDIARAQRQVRTGTERLKQQIQASPDVPDLQERVAHLDDAMIDMKQAENHLEIVRPHEALPFENSALRHLTAALAGLPKFVNWMTGGMTSPFPPDPMTSLSGQRVEVREDRYELFDAPKSSEKLDKDLIEALERVRALARRQKEFQETIRREQSQRGPGGGTGGGDPETSPSTPADQADGVGEMTDSSGAPPGVRLEKMREDAEESRRRLERLREEIEGIEGLTDPAGLDDETIRKLRESIETAARELGRLGEALPKPDLEEAQAANARALEELLDLELDLEKARAQNAQARTRDLAARLNDLIGRQGALLDATKGLGQKPPGEQQADGAGEEARKGLRQDQSRLGTDAKQTAQAFNAPDADDQDGDLEALREVGREVGQAADWMEQAAANIEQARDLEAIRGQEATLKQLENARDALDRYMAGRANDPLSRLQQALESVRDFKETMQARESQRESEAPDDLPQADSSVPRRLTRPARLVRVEIQNLRNLLEGDPQLLLLVDALARTANGLPDRPLYEAPETIGVIGQIVATLEQLEEALVEKMRLLDQKQRLEQTPRDELPSPFRDMAARYFEALSEGATEKGDGNENAE